MLIIIALKRSYSVLKAAEYCHVSINLQLVDINTSLNPVSKYEVKPDVTNENREKARDAGVKD